MSLRDSQKTKITEALKEYTVLFRGTANDRRSIDTIVTSLANALMSDAGSGPSRIYLDDSFIFTRGESLPKMLVRRRLFKQLAAAISPQVTEWTEKASGEPLNRTSYQDYLYMQFAWKSPIEHRAYRFFTTHSPEKPEFSTIIQWNLEITSTTREAPTTPYRAPVQRPVHITITEALMQHTLLTGSNVNDKTSMDAIESAITDAQTRGTGTTEIQLNDSWIVMRQGPTKQAERRELFRAIAANISQEVHDWTEKASGEPLQKRCYQDFLSMEFAWTSPKEHKAFRFFTTHEPERPHCSTVIDWNLEITPFDTHTDHMETVYKIHKCLDLRIQALERTMAAKRILRRASDPRGGL